jgi:hypothetical protein
MIEVMKSQKNFNLTPVQEIWVNEGDQIMAFMRGALLYVFNFSPTRSFTDYGFLVPLGEYDVVLNTDSPDYGGFGFADDSMEHFTNFDPMYANDGKGWLMLYIPARSAVVLRKQDSKAPVPAQKKTVPAVKAKAPAKKHDVAKEKAAEKVPADALTEKKAKAASKAKKSAAKKK